jgi:DeoR family transcriptional regulator of aga operon
VALAGNADIDQITMLITDSSADPEELERIRAVGVEVVIAD